MDILGRLMLPTASYRSALVAILASTSPPRPGCQDQAHSSSPQCVALWPVCRGNPKKQSQFCCRHKGLDHKLSGTRTAFGNPTYHLIYFLWSFIITSMKSSTVAIHHQRSSDNLCTFDPPFSSRTSTSQFNILQSRNILYNIFSSRFFGGFWNVIFMPPAFFGFR